MKRKPHNQLVTPAGQKKLKSFGGAEFNHGPTGKTPQRKKNDSLVFAIAGVAGLIILPVATAHADDANTLTNAPTAFQKDLSTFWNQQYMLGDWGGERSNLAARGVTFDLNNIGDFQSNVAGSGAHYATYFGRLRASSDIDFNKLANFDGELFISGIWQYGPNLSGQYLHVNTLTSSIAGIESKRLDQFWYQQGLFNDLFKVKIGQLATVNDFGATDFFDILFNDELGYAPNALFATRQPFSPAGKPGVEVWSDLSVVTPGLYAKAGIFTANDNPYIPDKFGIEYDNDFDHGWVASGEVGYVEQHTQYAGLYKVGINVNNLSYVNPATGQTYHGDYTPYGLVEKTVFHPKDRDGKLELNKGLDLLLEAVGAPGDRNALEYEVLLGGRYTGLIPGRDQDKIGFGLIYSENGSAFSQAYAATHGHGLGGETTVELDYQINPVAWFSFQIDNQVILDPGGDSQRSSIDVIGLRTIFRF